MGENGHKRRAPTGPRRQDAAKATSDGVAAADGAGSASGLAASNSPGSGPVDRAAEGSADFPGTGPRDTLKFALATTAAMALMFAPLLLLSGPHTAEAWLSPLSQLLRLALAAGAVYAGYRAWRWPRLRRWRFVALLLALPVAVVWWTSMKQTADRYNERWGQAAFGVGTVEAMRRTERVSKFGRRTASVHFRVVSEAGDGRIWPIEEASAEALAGVEDGRRIGLRMRRGWMGISFVSFVLCRKPAGDCAGEETR